MIESRRKEPESGNLWAGRFSKTDIGHQEIVLVLFRVESGDSMGMFFKNRFWTGNSTCTFPWVMSKVGIPPALSWSMGQKHHQHTHTVATRSEVEEHRQQNNNKASALAFFKIRIKHSIKEKISMYCSAGSAVVAMKRPGWRNNNVSLETCPTPDQTLVAVQKRYLLAVPTNQQQLFWIVSKSQKDWTW